MSTRWQRLGAFVVTAGDVGDDRLARFAASGGRWVAPVIYGDRSTGPVNLDRLEHDKERAKEHGIETWGWFNCFGGPAEQDAAAIAEIVRQHKLPVAILDLEIAYQYPQGNAGLMVELVYSLRKKLPNTGIGVSTNGMNNAMVWNGGAGHPERSFRALNIRAMPQWYTWEWKGDTAPIDQGQPPRAGDVRPDKNMRWLQMNGATEGNFAIPTGNHRGLPGSYVHGTLECTGLEGSSLAEELGWLHAAQRYGYTMGWSIYDLENTPDGDFTLMAAERGKTFLV